MSTRAGLAAYETAIDTRALATYRTRARDLEESIEEARARHDFAKLERAQVERTFLMTEIKAGIRFRNQSFERARKAVYNRIRQALRQLEAAHPALARHLSSSIKTGVHCTYRPESKQRWLT